MIFSKRTFLIPEVLLFSFCFVTSCKKSAAESDEQIQVDLHGKYSIVSAIADTGVDVNMDGITNQDLLAEISELKRSYLELSLRKNFSNYIYAQFWQNQYFLTGNGTKPTSYDPKVLVGYVNQATVATFQINQDQSGLTLSREKEDPAFPLPEKVVLKKDNQVEVTMYKNLYTKNGWKKVLIKVTYKRFTNEL